ncbi:MAG: DUF1501 domain-containing protein [Isosphaeraceae bacterium]|nr:DUF1501 domain-containing protein [Isosphaeraceae bacterium]
MRGSRRSLLRAGIGGFAGLGLPALLRAEQGAPSAAKAKHVIFLHQWGGPSHLDTFDMKPNAPGSIRGEFQPIASSLPGSPICEHLPRFSKVLHRFAQVRSVYHRMKNHNSAGYYSLTGHSPPIDDQRLRDTLELYPSYGSVVNAFAPVADPAMPGYVSFPHVIRDGSVTPGQGASFLGKPNAPFFVSRDPNASDFRLPELSLPASTPLERLDDRRGLLRVVDAQDALLEQSSTARGIDEFYDRALAMLASPRVKKAFDLSGEPASLRDAYGRTTYGQSCLLARRLIEAGVRFVTVYFAATIGNGTINETAGWDTHNNNFNDLKQRLLPRTDQTVPTLIEDLAARGLLDETLVLWMGEFGRTPRIGSTAGRDHWPQCYTVLMAGGGIRPGAIHGASDRSGAYPSVDPVRPDDIAATLYQALGIDPAREFLDSLGRPLPISAGRPIHELFG